MKFLKLDLSKIVLAAAAIALPFSASFASCSDLRYVTIHNHSGADLATYVENQCACFSQDQFDTSGKYTFHSGGKLEGRMKAQIEGAGCLFKAEKWVKVRVYLKNGVKVAEYKYSWTNGNVSDNPFADLWIHDNYRDAFAWTNQQQSGDRNGTASVTLSCKLEPLACHNIGLQPPR